ncbi:hypothetical protein ACS0TY_021461 [Phlomoides rotata]
MQEKSTEPLAFCATTPEELVALKGIRKGEIISCSAQQITAINPGNSGGPLLDISRNLIGINTAIYSPSGASCGVDPQSLFEEKESLEEKVVVREYELHLALEDIFNLKAELLKKTETNLDESKGINPSTYYLESPAVRLSMFILGCNVIQDEKGLST